MLLFLYWHCWSARTICLYAHRFCLNIRLVTPNWSVIRQWLCVHCFLSCRGWNCSLIAFIYVCGWWHWIKPLGRDMLGQTRVILNHFKLGFEFPQFVVNFLEQVIFVLIGQTWRRPLPWLHRHLRCLQYWVGCASNSSIVSRCPLIDIADGWPLWETSSLIHVW